MDFHEISGHFVYDTKNNLEHFGDDRFNPWTLGSFFYFLSPCWLATSRNTGWMDIHEIFRIWTQEAICYNVSRLSRLTLFKLGVAEVCPLGVLLDHILNGNMLLNGLKFAIYNAKLIRSRYVTAEFCFELRCIYLFVIISLVIHIFIIARLFGEMISTTMVFNTLYKILYLKHVYQLFVGCIIWYNLHILTL